MNPTQSSRTRGRPVTVSATVEHEIMTMHRARPPMSTRQIADALNAAGKTPPRGGDKWIHTTVAKIIKRVKAREVREAREAVS